MPDKPILCLDFDGVLHSYTSGWKGADVIPDPPVKGAIAFVGEAVKYFRVAIFSSRSNQPGGLEAMQAWLAEHIFRYQTERQHATLAKAEARAIQNAIKWPVEKPPALVTLDDRAITFTGEWPSLESLLAFKPWNKR